ncbi:YIP1 family protein [Salinibius halmophilus]|uniref:YIP1 family protein n=1 Tax=Salinibius halmophilus TaxID=1853216 RepID=UPI000E67366E|nr:YIP1 family protein [Salinibius halmophilus]
MNRWISYLATAAYNTANALFKYFVDVLRTMLRMLRSPKSTMTRIKDKANLGWGAIIIVLGAIALAQSVFYKQADVDYIFYHSVLPDLLPDQISPTYRDIQFELSLSELAPAEQTQELQDYIFEEVDREIITRPYEAFKANYQAGWVMIALAWSTWMMIVATAFKARLLRAKRINKPTYLQWFCMIGFVMTPMVLQAIWFALNALLSDGYILANELQPLTFSNYLPEGILAGILGLFSVFMIWVLVLLAMLWRYVAKVGWLESVIWTLVLGFFMLPLSIYMGG